MRIILLMAVLLHILVNLYCICDLYVEVSLIIFWILYPSSLGDILSMVTVLMLPHFKYCMRYERINMRMLVQVQAYTCQSLHTMCWCFVSASCFHMWRRTEKLVDKIEKPDATYRCYLFTLHNFCGLQACVPLLVVALCFICTGLQLWMCWMNSTCAHLHLRERC